MKKNNQVQEILDEIHDTHELLNKLWGYPVEDILTFLRNKGVKMDFDIFGYRAAYDRIGWYKAVEKLPKKVWLDAITLKPYFEDSGMIFRANEYLFSKHVDFQEVYGLKVSIDGQEKEFQTEFENYHYVLACECISWLRRNKLLK